MPTKKVEPILAGALDAAKHWVGTHAGYYTVHSNMLLGSKIDIETVEIIGNWLHRSIGCLEPFQIEKQSLGLQLTDAIARNRSQFDAY